MIRGATDEFGERTGFPLWSDNDTLDQELVATLCAWSGILLHRLEQDWGWCVSVIWSGAA